MTTEAVASFEFLKTALPKYPYPGLRPFEGDEWSIFFGRERMIDEVIERLAAHHLVFIHGASGSGKSSLVRAGVLPKLARQHLRADAPWRTCIIRPSNGPLWNLASGLAGLDGRSDDLSSDDLETVGEVMRHMNRRDATLSSIAASIKTLQGQRLCILVDQFEELFRFEKETSRAEAELFVDLLVSSSIPAVESAGDKGEPNAHVRGVHIVVTMRSEFLGECARFDGLAEAINETQYLVPRMDRESLLRAIRRPAMLYNGEVPLDLAERLIADVAGTEDELPLIQHGLLFMWNAARTKAPMGKILLDGAPFEDAGGLAQLLSRHADAVIEQAAPDPERRNAVERLFRALADLSVEGKAIRRPRPFGELVKVTQIEEQKLRDIIDVLRADAVSFLTPYAPERIKEGTTIDISHESLIRQWQKLSRWVENERRAGEEWQRLRADASKKFFLNIRELANALAFGRKIRPNEVWAQRYGGGFGSVKKLISTSIIANSIVGVLFTGVIFVIGWLLLQNVSHTSIIAQNFQTAVKSAQTLLHQVSDSLNRGDITAKGAKDMLQVGNDIVTRVQYAKTPDTIALVIQLAHTSSDIYTMLGDLNGAYERANDARQIAQALHDENPDNPYFVELLYNSIWRMADAISSRSLDLKVQEEALTLYLQALELARNWEQLQPNNSRPKRELMFIRQKIGDVRQVQEDWAAAIAEYTEGLRLIQQVVTALPNDLDRQADLANTFSRIGQALVGKGDLPGALQQYDEAFEIRTTLVKKAPDNDVFKSNLASSLRELGSVYALQRNFDAALKSYRRAIEIREALLHKDPGNAYWQITLAPLYTELGGILRQSGDSSGALAQYRKSYALRQDLSQKDPFNKDRQNNFAIACINVADVLEAQKQELDEAVRLYRDAIKTLLGPRPSKYDRYVFHSYVKIGDILKGQNKWDAAYEEYQLAVGIARVASENAPGSTTWQRNLGSSIVMVADFLVEQGRKAEALDYYQKAVEFVESLAAKYPNIPEWAALARSLREKMEALRI
jgi:tetratricopeptide (TPR) repeat protein